MNETISMSIEQKNSDGKPISRVTIEWFGLENQFANKMQLDVIGQIIEAVKGWDAIKNS
jgi:hypothetical protein